MFKLSKSGHESEEVIFWADQRAFKTISIEKSKLKNIFCSFREFALITSVIAYVVVIATHCKAKWSFLETKE